MIAQDVRQYISDTFQIDYQLRNVYRIMDALGFGWITSRSKHPKQSQQTQDTFKKFPVGNDPSHSGSLPLIALTSGFKTKHDSVSKIRRQNMGSQGQQTKSGKATAI